MGSSDEHVENLSRASVSVTNILQECEGYSISLSLVRAFVKIFRKVVLVRKHFRRYENMMKLLNTLVEKSL